jgi:hypothetical protein
MDNCGFQCPWGVHSLMPGRRAPRLVGLSVCSVVSRWCGVRALRPSRVVASNLYLNVCTATFFLFLMKYALSVFPMKITYAKVNYDESPMSERVGPTGHGNSFSVPIKIIMLVNSVTSSLGCGPLGEIFFFKCNERAMVPNTGDVLSEHVTCFPFVSWDNCISTLISIIILPLFFNVVVLLQ